MPPNFLFILHLTFCPGFRVPEEVTIEGEKKVDTEKPSVEDDAPDGNKEKPTNEPEEKEPEVKVYNFSSMLRS